MRPRDPLPPEGTFQRKVYDELKAAGKAGLKTHALRRRLALSSQEASNALYCLQNKGLIRRENGGWRATH